MSPKVVAARTADEGWGADNYQRHRPEQTLLYRIIERHYPVFTDQLAAQGTVLPGYVQREFEDFLKCGRLEHGFLRLRCDTCHAEHLVAFSCKRRGFCPSCGARRMVESAALLVDEVLPQEPMRRFRGGDADAAVSMPGDSRRLRRFQIERAPEQQNILEHRVWVIVPPQERFRGM